MVNASKLVERVPQMPDIQLPELPVDLDDVTDRLKDIGEAATSAARQAASTTARQAQRVPRTVPPVALIALLVAALGAFFLIRSRRSSPDHEA
jgi:hypothetical protein